jgi:hypothetical protein
LEQPVASQLVPDLKRGQKSNDIALTFRPFFIFEKGAKNGKKYGNLDYKPN